MREWVVASGVIEQRGELLLVCNRRRNGDHDWSPPGGVIDAGETVIEGLTREVVEETGLVVPAWSGPVYEVAVSFVDLEWDLRVETYRADSWQGDLDLRDPDGIVVDALFADRPACADKLRASPRWVSEPLVGWFGAETGAPTTFAYRVEGTDISSLTVSRL